MIETVHFIYILSFFYYDFLVLNKIRTIERQVLIDSIFIYYDLRDKFPNGKLSIIKTELRGK